MKFTVKAKTKTDVTVDYDDGTFAIFPINKGNTLDDITNQASLFNNSQVPFDSVDDVPVEIGKEYDTTPDGIDGDADYRVARRAHYPEIGKQLDALYWAREGDDTQSKSIDAQIKLVKETIPKTWKGKESEIPKLMD